MWGGTKLQSWDYVNLDCTPHTSHLVNDMEFLLILQKCDQAFYVSEYLN